MTAPDDRQQPVRAEHPAVGILTLDDPVGIEEQAFSGEQADRVVFVVDLGHHADREAAVPDTPDGAVRLLVRPEGG